MDELRTRLLRDAFLHDDPASYAAGVDAALRAITRFVQLVGDVQTAVTRSEVPRAEPA